MKRNYLLILLILAMLVASCAAPASKTEQTSETYPLTLKNALGEEFVLEKEPERIISLAPSATEILFAIGAGDKVVARNDYDEFPPEAMELPSVGSMMDPSLEAIVAAEPDLVVASNFLSPEMVQKVIDTGIAIVSLDETTSVQATLENILHIGKIVNREDGAKKVVDDMKGTLEEVQKALEGVEKVSVYYVVGFGEGGDYTATGDTFIHDMLTLAGGDNVAGDTEGWSYNLETLLQKDPQVVIVATEWDTKSLFLAEEGYQELSAVKNQQVYEIDTDLLQIQGPRVAQGVLEIAKILHPDKFTP